jgi:FtsH-binding integral membrane protein
LFSQYLEKQYIQGHQPFNMGLFIGLFVVEIILVGVIASAVNRISAAAATGLFLLYAALNGITLAGIFLVYAPSAIASAFIISAGTFGAMSVYGMLTQRDLTGMGRILFMGLIGVVIASVVSMFWHNSMLQVAINYIGVLVFVGLTAYDTQKLKFIADQTQDNPAMAARMSIVGSLTLYLDFINLFLFILRIMNQGRRN